MGSLTSRPKVFPVKMPDNKTLQNCYASLIDLSGKGALRLKNTMGIFRMEYFTWGNEQIYVAEGKDVCDVIDNINKQLEAVNG